MTTTSSKMAEKSRDEVPGDVNAFYGHPLVNGQAPDLALLHEFRNQPVIDLSDTKAREKEDSETMTT